MMEKSVFLCRDPHGAFELPTERISEWQPESHRPSRDPHSLLILLPSGRFSERTPHGRVFDLGLVRAWEPPARIILDCYLGTGPSHPAEVTIRFIPEEDGARIVIEHRPTPSRLDLWDARAHRYRACASWAAVVEASSKASEPALSLRAKVESSLPWRRSLRTCSHP